MSDIVSLPADIAARGPKKLSHTHEDIARWLVANPNVPLKDCAKHFDYSQSWLSIIIHSDAFQVRLRKLQAEADAVTVLDVPARLRGIAASALDALADQVDHAVKDGNGVLHREFLLSTSELTLKSLGYGGAKAAPPPAGPTIFQQNNFHAPVAPAVLAAAREKLLTVEAAPALQETSELPPSGQSDDSSLQRRTTLIPAATGPEGPETSGLDL